jgi:hypothetical protein
MDSGVSDFMQVFLKIYTQVIYYLLMDSGVSVCDDFDIKNQVTAAMQSMGALKNIWNSPHLDIWSKYLLFQAIPMNLLLWGCEMWLMWKALANKLEVFLHCNI